MIMVARYLPKIEKLWVRESEIGWEGVSALAFNLSLLQEISVSENKDIMQGSSAFGRIERLVELFASII